MSAPGLKRRFGSGDAEAPCQHDPLRDGEGVAQRGRVPGRAEGKIEQLLGFGDIKEAELRDGRGVDEASEKGVQRPLGWVVDWC